MIGPIVWNSMPCVSPNNYRRLEEKAATLCPEDENIFLRNMLEISTEMNAVIQNPAIIILFLNPTGSTNIPVELHSQISVHVVLESRQH
jgi:hypothetical protein